MEYPAEFKDRITAEVMNEFFSSLKIESQYYSLLLKQPILTIGEKNLYQAVKEMISKLIP